MRLKAARPVLIQLCLVSSAMVGCHGRTVEEADHHTPEHMPVDFPAAVERILELHVEITEGRFRSQQGLDAFAEAYDIARWLPDLAADSDLEEAAWNRVHSTANQLEVILADALAQNENQRRARYLQYQSELERHQRQLVEIKQDLPTSESSLAADH